MVVCTRFEQEIGRKPGTGERKVPSVPLRSSMKEGKASRQMRKVEMETGLWYSNSDGVDK